jgi:glycosyltransferase involved in cell wall biosynthesis
MARRLVDAYEETVLRPHAAGAATRQPFAGVQVLRYRYAPAALESLVNDGGIVANLKRHRWKWLLLPTFVGALAWRAWRLVRRERPAVVHAHWLIPQGVVAAAPGAPPFLVTSHGADLFALRAPPLQALKRFVARRAGALTVVSAAMRDELQRLGVDRARVTVAPMGTALQERFVPDARVPRTPGRLLFVGRLVEKKGLATLIEALPAILRERPDATLAVAGFGPELEPCRALAARLGVASAAQFLGAVPQAQLPALYRAANVFVAPFRRARDGDEEGLGLVSIEAGGCGCPLVLGDVAAVRGALGGLPGVSLVPPDDPSALAAACVAAMARPAPGAALNAALRERFDWSASAARYRGLLEALVP